MLRVLFAVDHVEGITGPHRNVVSSLNALARRDDVQVKLLTGKVDTSEPWYRSGRVELLQGLEPKAPARLWTNLAMFRAASTDCDLIYVPTNLSTFLLAQSVWPRRPFVAGPNVARLPLGKLDAPGTIELSLCDRWLEASDSRRDHVLRWTNRADRVVRVHHAIDNVKFSPAHRDTSVWKHHKISETTLKLTFVGRDDAERKGLPQLLDAVELLNSKRRDFELVLIGRMGGATLERIGRMPNAHSLGFQSGNELPRLVASSDVVVVPSSWENMPFVVLEAMASGVAIVASKTGGIPEQVNPATNSGILVDLLESPGQFAADAGQRLADALATALDSPTLRSQLGEGARNRAVNYFNEQRLGEELVQVFNETVALRGAQCSQSARI